MRLPFPIRIPLSYSCGFAAILCCAQVLEGTAFTFTLLSMAFILIATVAFNVAGGFSRPSGAYIFFYAVLAVILGLTYKAYLGEPADSNLMVPQTTMLVYVGGITGMLAAAFLKQMVLPAKGLLEDMLEKIDLDAASIGCMIVGAGIYVASALTIGWADTAEERYANNSGTLLSALNQVNQFLPLGIILGVTYMIKSTGGRRFLNTTTALGIIFAIAAFGIIGTSKQGLFQPIACVMIAAGALRYRFSTGQALVFLLGMVFSFYYLVPYVYVGRSEVPAETYLARVENAYNLVTDLGRARREMLQDSQNLLDEDDSAVHYFDSAQGIFDRLQMISIDDALIDVTEQGHVFGLTPLLFDVYNLVPHFIWPDKPLVALGNIYSHEISVARYSNRGEDDNTTGISFSPTADAFHMARWAGLLAVAPFLWFGCFFIMDWVCGDTRVSPWGLLMAALCSHLAPEGLMSGPFYLMTIGPLMVIFIALMSAYVLPLIGSLLSWRRRRNTLESGTTYAYTSPRVFLSGTRKQP
jgi:hypothetical protein